jgi:putative ABC transport system substrate-binding protein
VDLVLAIATPATQAIAGKTTEIPILGTAVTDMLLRDWWIPMKLRRKCFRHDGYESHQGSDRSPDEAGADAKTVGVLYTSSEDNSILQAVWRRKP